MAKWRIKFNLSDDPRSRAQLDAVLARQQVSAIRLTPHDSNSAQLSGDLVLDLLRDDELGEMLTALHTISPRVFVSRAPDAELAVGALSD